MILNSFPIDFPPYDLRFGTENGRKTIFDVVRKKFVALTPEEIVRQHIIHYLLTEKEYPKALLAVEMALTYNTMSRRCDIVAYHNTGQPLLIVECKAPEVKLSQAVFNQAARYNEVLQVPYLVITNGHECYCSRIDLEQQQYSFRQEIPAYSSLMG